MTCAVVYRQHIDDNADYRLRPRWRLVRGTWRTAVDRARCPVVRQTCS